MSSKASLFFFNYYIPIKIIIKYFVYSVESLTAYFGTINPSEKQTGEQKQVIDKSAFIIHENYSRQYLINDIALVKLPVPLEITRK